MSADPNVLNLLVDLPVRIDLLGHVLTAIARSGLVGTVELEDTEIVVIRVRKLWETHGDMIRETEE